MHMSLSIRFIVLSHLMHCCCCSCSSDCIASSALVSFSSNNNQLKVPNRMNSYHIRILHSKLSEKILQHNKSKSHHKPQYEQMRMQWLSFHSPLIITILQVSLHYLCHQQSVWGLFHKFYTYSHFLCHQYLRFA
jgi:hypothetical protein